MRWHFPSFFKTPLFPLGLRYSSVSSSVVQMPGEGAGGERQKPKKWGQGSQEAVTEILEQGQGQGSKAQSKEVKKKITGLGRIYCN